MSTFNSAINYWFEKTDKEGAKKPKPVDASKKWSKVHAKLYYNYGTVSGMIRLTQTEYTIGREDSSDFASPNTKAKVKDGFIRIPRTRVTQGVSRLHLRLKGKIEAGKFVYEIIDLGSSNGTKFGPDGGKLVILKKGDWRFFNDHLNGANSVGHVVELAGQVKLRIEYNA
jgi:hypothetical protein